MYLLIDRLLEVINRTKAGGYTEISSDELFRAVKMKEPPTGKCTCDILDDDERALGVVVIGCPVHDPYGSGLQ